MLAPLRDITGKIRYVLGAQIDVSNLVPNSTEMDEADSTRTPQVGFMGAAMIPANHNTNDELRDLNGALDAQGGARVLNWRAGTAQEERDDDLRSTSSEWQRPGVLSRGLSSASLPSNDPGGWVNSRLSGFYPYVSLIWDSLSGSAETCSTFSFDPTPLCVFCSLPHRCGYLGYCNHASWIGLKSILRCMMNSPRL
jgi:hypothetical protein